MSRRCRSRSRYRVPGHVRGDPGTPSLQRMEIRLRRNSLSGEFELRARLSDRAARATSCPWRARGRAIVFGECRTPRGRAHSEPMRGQRHPPRRRLPIRRRPLEGRRRSRQLLLGDPQCLQTANRSCAFRNKGAPSKVPPAAALPSSLNVAPAIRRGDAVARETPAPAAGGTGRAAACRAPTRRIGP